MTALLAFCLTVTGAITAAVPLEPVPVIATAYSCDAQAPMYPCNTTRWGNDPLTDGMACPPEWAHIAFIVPTQGLLSCDDTPRHSTLYGLPHVDIRMVSHGEAVAWGIREIVIYRIVPPARGQERKGI